MEVNTKEEAGDDCPVWSNDCVAPEISSTRVWVCAVDVFLVVSESCLSVEGAARYACGSGGRSEAGSGTISLRTMR